MHKYEVKIVSERNGNKAVSKTHIQSLGGLYRDLRKQGAEEVYNGFWRLYENGIWHAYYITREY